MEKIKRLSNQMQRDIAFMKWRWVGNIVIVLALIVGIVIVSARGNYIVVDRQGVVSLGSQGNADSNKSMLIEGEGHMRIWYSTFFTFDHTTRLCWCSSPTNKMKEDNGKKIE